MTPTYFALSIVAAWLPLCSGHASIWHPSMWGFNVTGSTYPVDNRPVVPLYNMTFNEWWFHGHLDHPPNPGDFFELPAGGVATAEVACTKAATSYHASSDGGDIQDGNNPCPHSPLSAIHTNGFDDLTGCAMAIAYKDDVNDVKPEDFTVFSVNHACVWTRYTDFPVPARMPPCPEGGCTCAWFWIHSPDSGSEQNYMNGFKCKVTNSTSNVALAKPQLPRRCGADPNNGRPEAVPGNCTYGAKQPFYWLQQEQNNMFEGYYAPPFYTDLYNFKNGAQDDIFLDSYESIPPPSPNSTVIPTPADRTPSASTTSAPATSSQPASSTQSPMPTSSANTTSPQPGSKHKLCKLHSNNNAQVPLSRRSLFRQVFLARSKTHEARRFSLWHPF